MKKIITTSDAPQAIGPYSQAIETNGRLYVSGQIPIDPENGTMPEGIARQTEQVLRNIGAILSAAGYSFNDVVKTTVLMKNMADFATMNEIYARYFTEKMPARACFGVSALPKNAEVEIEVIAEK
ncbi:MAG TPA: RidA family protein [Candidatus Alistipes merdigallinarum]|nr:RidA family protein [Candidatus Alistipes merdigallinarum]